MLETTLRSWLTIWELLSEWQHCTLCGFIFFFFALLWPHFQLVYCGVRNFEHHSQNSRGRNTMLMCTVPVKKKPNDINKGIEWNGKLLKRCSCKSRFTNSEQPKTLLCFFFHSSLGDSISTRFILWNLLMAFTENIFSWMWRWPQLQNHFIRW